MAGNYSNNNNQPLHQQSIEYSEEEDEDAEEEEEETDQSGSEFEPSTLGNSTATTNDQQMMGFNRHPDVDDVSLLFSITRLEGEEKEVVNDCFDFISLNFGYFYIR